jgi:mRNA interferase HigB
MQVLSKSTLKAFWMVHPQSEVPLQAWYVAVSKAVWTGPADIKTMFGASVDFVADNRVIFDISGNKYRLIVHVSYKFKRVLVKFIGTHADYDKINAETV